MALINYQLKQNVLYNLNKGRILTWPSLALFILCFSLAFINSASTAIAKTMQKDSVVTILEQQYYVEPKNIMLIANHAYISTNQSISTNELAAIELKLLQKTYENDPLSKRLQRLELLTFGTTQYGSNIERWHNIQSYLCNKNNNPKSTPSAVNGQKHSNVVSSLNELEKYVFKKTSPTETASKRLDKLEAKLFGKSSSNVPVEQRIARLQRTLGLASTPQQMANIPNGVLPPSMRGFNTMPYFRPGQPGMPNIFGFGFNRDDMTDPDLSQFESQMSQIFDQMERQMQEQMREQGKSMPREMPNYGTPQIVPQPNQSPGGDKIPSYNDPNFI